MLKKLNKMNLTIAILLAFVSGINAQSVKVPNNCTVVDMGVGPGVGILGPGGRVKDGGVVIMPDNDIPNGGAIFTFDPSTVTPTGTIIQQLTTESVRWRLKGDLSSSTSSVFGSPTQPANGLNAVIKSYNKKLSNNESKSPSQALFARSRGEVTASYTLVNNGTPCGASIRFEIYKTYPLPPSVLANEYLPIAGPPCVKAGELCSFYVEPIASENDTDIPRDMYYWSGIPQGATEIMGQGSNAIRFISPNDGYFKLECCVGRANPWDGGFADTRALTGTICATKEINTEMAEPVYKTKPSALCVKTSADAEFDIEYPVSNYTYQWSTPTVGWTIGTQTSASVKIYTNGYHNPGILYLDIIGCNKSRRFTYNIKRSLTAPVVIAPVNGGNGCVLRTSDYFLTQFAISESAAQNPIIWTLTPSGFGLTFQPNGSRITVSSNSSAGPNGEYTLTARVANDCTGAVISYKFKTVEINIKSVSGTFCVQKGTSALQTYTCTNIGGVDLNGDGTPDEVEYKWTFPAGWGATSFTTNTNQIIVTPSIDANAVLNGVATVRASFKSGGCTGQAYSFDINYASTAPTSVVANCFSVGIEGTASVSIANPTPGTYSAFLYPTVNGIPNVSTNLVTSPVTLNGNILRFSTSALTASTQANSYNLTISHNGLCGGPAPTTIPVTVVGNGATVSRATATNPNRDVYTAVAPFGMINPQYEWTACTPAGVCSIIGGNTATLTLSGTNTPPAGSQICVTVFPLGSCKTRVCAAQGQYSVMATNDKNIVSVKDIGNAIYPNPNTGTFNIKIGDFKKSATATLYDISGRKIKDFKLVKGINKIENEKLSLGNYLVVLYIDGKKEVKKIVIK